MAPQNQFARKRKPKDVKQPPAPKTPATRNEKRQKFAPLVDPSPSQIQKRRQERERIQKAAKQRSWAWALKARIMSELLREMQVVRVSDSEARHKYNLRAPAEWDLTGFLIPLLDRAGKPTGYYLLRRDNHGADQGKYHATSAKIADRTLYAIPRAWKRLDNEGTIIVLVEAAKSVLALESWARRMKRTNFVFLGMGGCYGWRDKDAKDKVLPDMKMCAGQNVIVMLDSNVTTSKQVHEARLRLNALLFSMRCEVAYVEIPREKDAGGEIINGPDDYIAAHTDGEVDALLNSARDAVIAPHSQHALAERFAGENIDNVRYVPNVGWFVWDGNRWKRDEEGRVEMLVQNLCAAAAAECLKEAEQTRMRSRAMRESILREAQPHLATSLDKFDSDPMLLNTPGGTVDLRTGELRPAQREDFCTKMASAVPTQLENDNRWLKFLDEIMQVNQELVSFIQRVCGYCLTGNVNEHALFFLFGGGSNGKGTFVRVLLGILGEYTAVIDNSMLMVAHNEPHPTGLAALRGARIATGSEVEDGARWAEAKIKAITGGDPITARFMRQDFFTFSPQFKLLIQGNHKPAFRNVGVSIQRRFNLVPFNATFDEVTKDKTLDEALKAEFGGILQWCIDGCLAWQREGLNPPAAVREATEKYLAEQDRMGEFLAYYTRDDNNGKVLTGELYSRYKTWADNRGEIPLTQTAFTPKLEERGFMAKKSNGVRYIAGLRWLTPKEMAARLKTEAKIGSTTKFAPKATPKVVQIGGRNATAGR